MQNNKLNETIIHSCSDNNCNGAGLKGLHVKCSKCGSKIFLECLKNRTAAAELLKVYGIITSNFDVVTNSITTIQQSFNVIFDHNSPFAIYCAFCRLSTEPSMRETIKKMEANVKAKQIKIDKFEAELTELRSKTPTINESESAKIVRLFGTRVIEAVKKVVDNGVEAPVDEVIAHQNHENDAKQNTATIMVNAESSNCSQIVPINPVNGVYSIHVSRMPKEFTTDRVTDIIIENSNTNKDSFNVEKHHNKRFKGKSRHFSSFKISTFSRQVCEFIINKIKGLDSNYIVQQFVAAVKVQNNLCSVNTTTHKIKKHSANHNESERSNIHERPPSHSNNNVNKRENNNDRRQNSNQHQRNDYRHNNQRNRRQINRRYDRQDYNRNRNSDYWQNRGQFRQQQQQFPSVPFWQHPYFYPPFMIPGQQHQHQQPIPPQTQLQTQIHAHSQPQPMYQY